MRLIDGVIASVMIAWTSTGSMANAQSGPEPFSYGPVAPDSGTIVTTTTVEEEVDDPGLDAFRRPTRTTSRDASGTTVIHSSTTRTAGGGLTTVTVTTGPGASWGMVSPSWRRGDSADAMRPPVRPSVRPSVNIADGAGSTTAPRLPDPVIANLDDRSVTREASAEAVRIPRDPSSGHFITQVVMNGIRTRVIIDTGASGTILSPDAARATGALRDVTHSRLAAGIGGVTALNATRVRSLVIGGREIGSFDALIGREGIPYTLLGQTELRRLGRIVIEDDVLTITPRESVVASR